MWVDCDDECVRINTELHRQKFKNVEADPRAAVCIWDKDDPYHYIEVRGDVIEVMRRTGPEAHRRAGDALLRAPLRRRVDPERRAILRIRPLGSPKAHGGGGH